MTAERDKYGEGDHRLVTIPTAGTTVAFHFYNPNSYTSANDTSGNKYFDNNGTCHQFLINADKAVELVGINEVTFVENRPIVANTNYSEKDCKYLTKIQIKTTTSDTVISVRAR